MIFLVGLFGLMTSTCIYAFMISDKSYENENWILTFFFNEKNFKVSFYSNILYCGWPTIEWMERNRKSLFATQKLAFVKRKFWSDCSNLFSYNKIQKSLYFNITCKKTFVDETVGIIVGKDVHLIRLISSSTCILWE